MNGGLEMVRARTFTALSLSLPPRSGFSVILVQDFPLPPQSGGAASDGTTNAARFLRFRGFVLYRRRL